MATRQDIANINIDGTMKSLRQLREEIVQNIQALNSMDDSTEEYNRKLQETVQLQTALEKAQKAGKSQLDAQTGSYNALQNELTATNRVMKALTGSGGIQTLQQQSSSLQNTLKEQDAQVGIYTRNVGNYEESIRNALKTPQQELRALRQELANLEQGTEEYNAVFTRMTQLTHDVTEQQEQLRWASSDLGDILTNLVGITGSLMGGFSALQGLAGLISSNNEALDEALVTTQRFMQVIQGLQAFEEFGDRLTGLIKGFQQYRQASRQAAEATQAVNTAAEAAVKSETAQAAANTRVSTTAAAAGTATKAQAAAATTTAAASTAAAGATTGFAAAMRGLAAAITSTGIGAIIVAIGVALAALVNAISNYVKNNSKAARATKAFAEANEQLNESLEATNRQIERQEKLMEAQGKSYDEIYQAKRKAIQAQIAETEAIVANMDIIRRQIGEKKLEKDKYDELNESYKETTETLANLRQQLSDLDYDNYIHGIEEARKAQEKADDEERRRLEESTKAREDAVEDIRRAYENLVVNYLNSTAESNTLNEVLEQTEERVKSLNDAVNAGIISMAEYRDMFAQIQERSTREQTRAINSQISSFVQRQMQELQQSLSAMSQELQFDRFAEDFDLSAVRDYFNEAFKMQEETVQTNLDALAERLERTREVFGKDSEEYVAIYAQMLQQQRNLAEAEQQRVVGISSYTLALLQDNIRNANRLLEDEVSDINNRVALADSEAGEADRIGALKRAQEAEDEIYALRMQSLQSMADAYRNALTDEALTAEQRVQIEQSLADTLGAIQDEEVAHAIQSNQLKAQSYQEYFSTISGISSSIGDIMGTVADVMIDNAERQLESGQITQAEYERQFEQAKSIQVAQAIINTIAGAVAAFMGITSSTGGFGIALAAVQAAAVLAAGFAQVQQIRNTEPNSNSSSSSASYAVATPTLPQYTPQNVTNVTGESENEDLANAIQQQPIWVSVKDIDSAQQRVQVRDRESTF